MAWNLNYICVPVNWCSFINQYNYSRMFWQCIPAWPEKCILEVNISKYFIYNFCTSLLKLKYSVITDNIIKYLNYLYVYIYINIFILTEDRSGARLVLRGQSPIVSHLGEGSFTYTAFIWSKQSQIFIFMVRPQNQ